MPAPRRYLTRFLLVLAAGLALVAAVNVTVDPYATFRWTDIDGFNQAKTLKRDGGRVNKSIILDRYRFDVLFLGTSQGEVGLDPASPVLDGAQAFNASLSNSNMGETADVAAYAVSRQSPRLVVIALDWMAFSTSRVRAGDFFHSGFAGASHLPAYVRRLFDLDAMRDSFGVVRRSLRGEGQVFGKLGRVDPGIRRHHDFAADFAGSLRGYLASEGAGDIENMPQHSLASFTYDPRRVTLLAEVVKRFTDRGSQVALFVAPVHARYLTLVDAAGFMAIYDQWKRDLAAGLSFCGSGKPCRLWDFSGYSAVAAETVPRDSDSHGTMRYYWDPGHFSAEVGDMILARMLGREDRVGPLPPEFGRELTPASVETILKRFHEQQAEYRQRFPDEVALAERLVADMAPRVPPLPHRSQQEHKP